MMGVWRHCLGRGNNGEARRGEGMRDRSRRTGGGDTAAFDAPGAVESGGDGRWGGSKRVEAEEEESGDGRRRGRDGRLVSTFSSTRPCALATLRSALSSKQYHHHHHRRRACQGCRTPSHRSSLSVPATSCHCRVYARLGHLSTRNEWLSAEAHDALLGLPRCCWLLNSAAPSRRQLVR